MLLWAISAASCARMAANMCAVGEKAGPACTGGGGSAMWPVATPPPWGPIMGMLAMLCSGAAAVAIEAQ